MEQRHFSRLNTSHNTLQFISVIINVCRIKLEQHDDNEQEKFKFFYKPSHPSHHSS